MKNNQICDALQALKQQNPLVLNITNYVVMNNTANALLAIGASPIMAHSKQEMAEMLSFCGALVINIGTLDSSWIESMSFAIEQANRHHKTVVLDPVGCGATKLRLNAAQQFAKQADNLIIRANASEIIALAGQASQAKGVDSLDDSKKAIQAVKRLVAHYEANVVVSGADDYVVTATEIFELSNGDAMMPLVTGMGCTLTALTGAFAAIGDKTGLTATALLGVAGEIAAAQSKGPASLQMNLIDTLYSLDQETLLKHLKLKELAYGE